MHNEKGFIRPAAVLAALALLVGLVLGAGLVFAAPPKFSLEQCRNGSATSPNDCVGTLGGGSGWVAGNAGASQAHFVEGHSIPYRGIATDMPTTGTHTVTLGYDIKHSGANAIDFLTHYDRLLPHGAFGHPAETVTPTSGVSGIVLQGGVPATCDIAKPGNLSTGASNTFNTIEAQDKAVFTIFGAAGCSTEVGTAGDINAAQSEATIVVEWTCPCSSTMVFAWGGHIARSSDWDGNGAAGISGSPYHMRTKTWTINNLGNQDRSLSAAAVIAEQTSVVTQLQALDGTGNPTSNVGLEITVSLGTSVRDSATVTPTEAEGLMAFRYYASLADCQASTIGTGSGTGGTAAMTGIAVTGVAPNTVYSSTVTLGAGTYYWRAFFSANAGFEDSISDCNEILTVSKANLTVTTNIHAGTDHATNYDRNATGNGSASVPVGSVVHDVAFVSGAVTGFAPTGAITFTMWTNGTCNGTGSALATSGADEGGFGTKSVDTSALDSGDYSFKATIAADDNYNTDTSDCEWLKVDSATPGLSTAPTVSVVNNDTATLSGLYCPASPCGTVTFELYQGDDTCTNAAAKLTPTGLGPFNVTGNGNYSTNNTTAVNVTADTVFYWKVVYSGDTNNATNSSNCVESVDIDITGDAGP